MMSVLKMMVIMKRSIALIMKTRFRWCCLLCWGAPTILTIATAIIEFMPEGILVEGTLLPGLGLDKCFFSSYSAQVIGG